MTCYMPLFRSDLLSTELLTFSVIHICSIQHNCLNSEENHAQARRVTSASVIQCSLWRVQLAVTKMG